MKILVMRFSSLGDVVLISPLFQKIKERYPDSNITFLTSSEYVELFKNNPFIEEIIGYDPSSESLFSLLKFVKRIRKDSFDLILDCQINPRSLIFLLLGRGVTKKRIDKFSRKRREMVSTRKPEKIPHAVERYLRMIDSNTIDRYRVLVYLEESEIKSVERSLRVKTNRKIVGFVPGASKRTKMWDVEKLKELAHILIEKDQRFLIFFGTEEEGPLNSEIREGIKDHCIDLSGKTSVRELALYLKLCDVLLTTDSGPMHIAVAVGTPVVALFGPTVPEFGFSPYDEKSVIISKVFSCRPCSLHGTDTCPLNHHHCMGSIEVEEVRKALNKRL
jgi:heptosyltransferase-2